MNRLALWAFIGTLLPGLPGLCQEDTAPPPQAERVVKPESVLFEALPVVEAASLHAQTLLEAPANVTVITSEDIRRRAYRTLADVLADVRGMYVTYDRTYHYVGVRGVSIPGDANNRFLVMINGHSLTENVFGSANYFGEDFGLDLDLIERIEIVRGPSSALYGTNGMFATINIITKSPVEYDPLRVSAELDSFGERKGQISGSAYLGRGANLLYSVSAFNNSGQSALYFPAFDTPADNHGVAVDSDGERGYHTFANLIWNNWSFTGYFNNREKIVPTAYYGTVFNDRGDKAADGRGFVEAAYRKDVGVNGKLRWRIYYDRYRFLGRFDFQGDAGIADARNTAAGDWLGTELTYRFHVPRLGFLTVGSDVVWDLRAQELAYYAAPVEQMITAVNRPDRSGAAFFQDELQLSRRWTLYLGGRADASRNHQLTLTPRVALIYQPSEASAVKLLYGRSFRNPAPYEQFYEDGITQIANPGLRDERMQTFEADFEKRLNKTFEVMATIYHYRLDNLIQAALLNGVLQQYQNIDLAQATGLGMEGAMTLRSGLKMTASLALEKSAADESVLLRVNSPSRVGKLLLDTPLWRNRWSLSAGLQYMSERLTMRGDHLSAVYSVNLAAASRRLPAGLELQAGIHNLFNYQYWDPAGTVQEMDRIQQDGRSFFLRLTWAAPHETDRAPAKRVRQAEEKAP